MQALGEIYTRLSQFTEPTQSSKQNTFQQGSTGTSFTRIFSFCFWRLVTRVQQGSVQTAQTMVRSSLYKLSLKLWCLIERQLLRGSLCPTYEFFSSWFKNISPSLVLLSINLQNAIRHHAHIELPMHMISANPSLIQKLPLIFQCPLVYLLLDLYGQNKMTTASTFFPLLLIWLSAYLVTYHSCSERGNTCMQSR